MDRDGYKFDLVTQRFIVNRWDTELGRQAREEIIDGLKNSVEVRAILDPYVLDHPENISPYGYPHYPKDAMTADAFWVLTQDDLRGIRLYNEDFSGSPSFEKKSLTYSSFYNCDLSNVDFASTDLSYARFEKCKMDGIIFAGSGGFSTKILSCSLHNACIWQCGFRDCNFSGTDFTGAYFEDVVLEDVKVNYLTHFDVELKKTWKTRRRPDEESPDIYRSIRLAYGCAELWSLMDRFLEKEKIEQRKFILWPQFRKEKSLLTFMFWLSSLISGWSSGYSTKPKKVLFIGMGLATLFAFIYLIAGVPINDKNIRPDIFESIYFSFTSFATLGYGDLHYNADHPFLRILSTAEAFTGAIIIALYVVLLSRKLFR